MQDPDLLRVLAAQRLDADKDRFEHQLVRNGRKLGEKWGLADLRFAWAASPPQIKQHGYVSTDYELRIRAPERGALPKKQAAVYASMKTRLAAMIDEDGEPLDGLEQQHAELEAQMVEMHAQRTIILPKAGAVVGVASIDQNGAFDVELWFADRAAKGVETPRGAKGQHAGAVAQPPAEAERARYGLSKDAMQVMMLVRRDMIRTELMQSGASGSPLALDFLLYTHARTILTARPGYSTTVHYAGGKQGIDDLPHDEDGTSKIGERVAERLERAAWLAVTATIAAAAWVTAPDPIDGFVLFRQLPEAERHRVAALIAGHMLRATTSIHGDGRTPRMVRELANHIEAEPGFGRWRDAVDLDEAFFATFSHKALLALLERWGLADRAKGMKASETAPFCARIANCTEIDAKLLGLHPDDVAEAVNWLPDFLASGPVAPLALVDERVEEPAQINAGADESGADAGINDNHGHAEGGEVLDEAA